MRSRLATARDVPAATWALAALLVAGVALRVVAAVAVWPVSTTLADAGSYAGYAARNPLTDPSHPAGYSSVLAVIGVLTRDVAVVTLLQQALGIATALLFYAAVRRLTGSRWAGLLPAAIVLLNADLLFLERNVMSESLFMGMLGITFYAAVRAFDAPYPLWRWPAATGALLGLSTIVRSTAVFLLPVVVVALWLAHPVGWRRRWRPPAAAGAVAVLLLVLYAFANLSANGELAIAPKQGWHLYGRVAPFADCRDFTPPKGTEGLCESTPVPQRPNGSFYMYDSRSPLGRVFGANTFKHDADLRAFAFAVITHQPRAYATAMWKDIKVYFAPPPLPGGHLDGDLDWYRAASVRDPTTLGYQGLVESFFNRFHATASRPALNFLHDYQRVFRFGATMLSIASLLTLIGLLVGPRRARIGVFMFGIGGLALLAAPVVSVFYVARYEVPVSAPLLAGAAITMLTLRRLDEAGRALDDQSLVAPASSRSVGAAAGAAASPSRRPRAKASSPR